MSADQMAALALLITAVTTSFVTVFSLLYKAKVERDDRAEAREARLALAKQIDEVHHEVKTGNGHTIGALADMAEGRAAELIAKDLRTASEQAYVERKQHIADDDARS